MSDSTLRQIAARLQLVSDVYAERNNVTRDPTWYLLKVQEELGEVVAEYLRLHGGKAGVTESEVTREALRDECADLLAHVLLFAHQNDIDLDGALQRKWFKHLGARP